MSKKKIDNIYDEAITLTNLYHTWKTVKKTCKNKKAVYRFAVNQNTNIYNIYMALKNKTYKPLPFRLFLIFEPKERLVMSQHVTDKIVNHFVANYYLLPYLEKKLIDTNIATRKNKGSSKGIKYLEDYINEIRIKQPKKEIYCLNIDISKYFYNINHQLLLEQLNKDISDKDVLNIVKTIINETNSEYVNRQINMFNKKYKTSIPYYEKDVGLSIGAMTSQFLAIYYLNGLDHFIKEKLKCKYYIRYMDDFIILDTNLDHLKNIWQSLDVEIKKIKLNVNNKSGISKLSNGISFLGYKYQIQNNKLKIMYKSKTIKKIRKKLQRLKLSDKLKYYLSYSSYYGYLKKVKKHEREFCMKAIEKYDYYKEKKPKSIILIKEGSFYKTYKNDAVILWHLFNYKWNNNSISFGISPYSKVLDKLNKLELSYVVVEENEIIVDNNESVYELYDKLANIRYTKHLKKEELLNKLHNLLDADLHNYELISEFFNSLERN